MEPLCLATVFLSLLTTVARWLEQAVGAERPREREPWKTDKTAPCVCVCAPTVDLTQVAAALGLANGGV